MRAALLALALAAQQAPDETVWQYRQRDPATFEAEMARLRAIPRRTTEQASLLSEMMVVADARSERDAQNRLMEIGSVGMDFRRRLHDMIRGRNYSTQWLNSRWANSAFTTRDPDARALFRRVFADQWALQNALPADFPEAGRVLIGGDIGGLTRFNAEWLQTVLARIGWFDISRYGAEASQAAWLIVQHADHDPAWQNEMLAVLAPRVARGDMQRNYYAYLVDRVAVNAGRPQTYGTQGRCMGRGNLQLFEVADRDALDRRRAEMGLEPLDAYRERFCGRSQ